MKLSKVAIKKSDERGTIYKIEKFNLVIRKKGTTSADHSHPEKETLYLIEGRAEITVDDETQVVEPVARLEFPENTYHKLVALSDIMLLYYR